MVLCLLVVIFSTLEEILVIYSVVPVIYLGIVGEEKKEFLEKEF